MWVRKFVREHSWFVGGVGFLAAISVIVLYAVLHIAFKVCVPIDASELDKYKQTISALDGIADVSIKLSTALVGFGVAILIGLKTGVHLSKFVRFFLLVATICFAQSALYAILWRMGVAELWLNECLSLISQPMLTARYGAHFYFFIAGLAAIAVIVFGAALDIESKTRGSK
jgi:hypothetical protein